MPTSDARAEANRRNAAKSCGPRTEAGKAASRRNALKHGLTAEVVIPEAEAAEVERKFTIMKAEMRPSSELAADLVHDIAAMSVRMKRCQLRETAHLTERVRAAIDGVIVPEGASPEEVAELRAEAADLALFDDSREAELARKYEAAARRAFYKAIAEFRKVEADAKAEPEADPASECDRAMAELASFLKATPIGRPAAAKPAEAPRQAPLPAPEKAGSGASFVPISVGKPR